MAFAVHRLIQNRFILSTSILAISGWIIAFAGAVSLQTLYGAWWVVVYQAFIVAFSLLLFMSNTMAQYRLTFLTFIAASIPLLTIQADYVIQYTKPSVPKDPANAYAAGYIILVFVQYLWVIVFGSDPNSYLGAFGRIVDDEQPQHQQASYHQQQQASIEQPVYLTTEKHLDDTTAVMDKRIVMPPYPTAAPVTVTPTDNTAYSPATTTTPLQQQPQQQSSPQQPTHSEYLPPAVEYIEKVEALHAYKANQEDPNELSFEKGEILEVVDRKGNWWQARKSNGAIGIIPSNYFAPPTASNSSAGSN
ncbi:hypothetical protein BDB00DRAFT_977947 [Zychaea mexicana]|uniref:uncharacterized protein n=1 Tax=Zychaea mexicana TaxID=64656 RepID=UPI0022FDDA55|nr:uncharacterized protein BDB00DRAFT_977947 [Zychaea mexicana]KAI9491705.1 hypothetical protein BDB00DRAFT_977947 [Zychaea mexicana]